MQNNKKVQIKIPVYIKFRVLEEDLDVTSLTVKIFEVRQKTYKGPFRYTYVCRIS